MKWDLSTSLNGLRIVWTAYDAKGFVVGQVTRSISGQRSQYTASVGEAGTAGFKNLGVFRTLKLAKNEVDAMGGGKQ